MLKARIADITLRGLDSIIKAVNLRTLGVLFNVIIKISNAIIKLKLIYIFKMLFVNLR